jgi:hypothetical protein
MTQAYIKMGMPQLAADSLRVLERNYPQSPELPKLNALVKAPANGPFFPFILVASARESVFNA